MRVAFLLAAAVMGCSRGQPVADSAVGQKVADEFVAKILAGQLEPAWESTTAEFKSDEGRESFIREVRAKPAMRGPINFLGYEMVDLNGLKRGQCLYELTGGQKSAPGKLRILVANENGSWRVDGLFME